MVEERGGWFVKNVRDATWLHSEAFGEMCAFDAGDPFPQVGFRIFVLEPGKRLPSAGLSLPLTIRPTALIVLA